MLVYLLILGAVSTTLLAVISAQLRRIAEAVERRPLTETVFDIHELMQHPDESDKEFLARAAALRVAPGYH